MMVIGWYHSHPHITVFPSHVGELLEQMHIKAPSYWHDSLDLKTQLSQQLMDEKFFGIIVSCFDSHNDNVMQGVYDAHNEITKHIFKSRPKSFK